MSIYKIIIGKDMAPQNKNTSHIIKLKKFLPGELIFEFTTVEPG